LLGACSAARLPKEPPPLADMEEPLDLREEPKDEAERAKLPLGCFSGLRVDDARDTLAAKLDAPVSLRVVEVVENSPAQAAGLQVDDVLLEVQVGEQPPQPLQRPSEWRQVELANPPGTKVVLVVDRAGREAKSELVLAPRLRGLPREEGERFREEERVGIAFRTATEVEARAAGMGPGAGAVLIGLSRSSPWRADGIRFGDLIAHPQVVLDVLRDTSKDSVALEYVRGGQRVAAQVALSTRSASLREVSIPVLFDYESERGKTEWSVVFGLLGYESTAAAWRFRLLWIVTFGGGDADRLLEVDR
jgi:hypothetical protein